MFRCGEEVVKDGFCVFHHPTYWKEKPEDVAKKFYEKVEKAIKNNEKLLCIGYNLPKIDLSGKEFPKPTYFSWATFKTAYFRWATFNETAYFRWATFDGEATFISLKEAPAILFEVVSFKNPEKVVFDDFDLSNVSFVYTDISRVNFGERIRWDKNKKHIDERRADKGEVPYEVVATVYRRLRQNLESKMRYTEAGRFFIAEMNVKRKNVKTKNRLLKWLRTNIFSALAWYKHFSNYGESYTRILTWIMATPFLMALIEILFKTPPPTMTTPVNIQITTENLIQSLTVYSQYLKRHTYAFFQLRTETTFELATRILSLLLMGQLYVALRRQFERKYRATATD